MCILLMIFPVLVFGEGKKIKVTGKISGLGTNQVVIVNSKLDRVATCVSENNKFEMEFMHDLDKELSVFLYIPHIDPHNTIQPFNCDLILVDNEEVKITGKIKGIKVENFRARSTWNDQYYAAKFEVPSADDRLKAEEVCAKAWETSWKFKNEVKKADDGRNVNTDPECKALSGKAAEAQGKVSELNVKCTFEAAQTLTPEIKKGLNAFLYATSRSLRYDLLKTVIEEIRKNYTQEQIDSDFFLSELNKIFNDKATRYPGEPIINYDLVDQNGNIVRFADFKGRYLYINCYDLTYEPSMEELKKVMELEKQYKDKNIKFLHLNVNKDRDEWRKFCKDNNITDHININDQAMFFPIYKVTDLPRGILIDDKGLMHTFKIGVLYGDHDDDQKNMNNGKTIDLILKDIF